MQTAKLFSSGRSQAVRLPKQFRFSGEEVYIKKVGETVVLIPKKASWDRFFDILESFDTPIERNQPPQQEREEWL